MDCTLNQRSIAEPDPLFWSRAFSTHNEKLRSMTFTKLPWPDLVMYFVMYSTTASFVSVAWKSQLDSIASMMMGTKLFKK